MASEPRASVGVDVDVGDLIETSSITAQNIFPNLAGCLRTRPPGVRP
jgi:hypothetical protein